MDNPSPSPERRQMKLRKILIWVCLVGGVAGFILSMALPNTRDMFITQMSLRVVSIMLCVMFLVLGVLNSET